MSVQEPNIRNDFTCTFCLKVTKKGASRMKQHLVGGFPNVTKCPQCPDHIRKEMIDYMKIKQVERDNIQMVSRKQDLDDNYYGDEEEDCIEITGSTKLPPRKKPKLKGPIDMFSTLKLEDAIKGKILEAKRPHLYWTPCLAHCIDPMLEDIDKKNTKKKAFEIIDHRWKCQLHRPLHATGHYLNPRNFYDNKISAFCEEVMTGLYSCIERLVLNSSIQDKITTELATYQNAKALLSNKMAIRLKKTKAPVGSNMLGLVDEEIEEDIGMSGDEEGDMDMELGFDDD
uniref:DUF659 domain-containing protein n=1 Tax=Lactuca sativa TaxID=4236 RepID=A0A9R1VI29_LACSA|nr:hypothetical protein LSAT_V11C500230670 [Lactuca sativa]